MVTDNKDTLNCAICGKIFFARKDARFCSTKCRKRASRGGIKASGKPNQTLYDVCKKALYELSAMDAQNSIKAVVILALELLDDNNKKKIYDMLKDYPFEN